MLFIITVAHEIIKEGVMIY